MKITTRRPHLKLIASGKSRQSVSRSWEEEATRLNLRYTAAKGRQARILEAEKVSRVSPLPEPCACAVPVRCFTNGEGGVIQTCLRCGAANIVERRSGIPTVSKARAAELKIFSPGERL